MPTFKFPKLLIITALPVELNNLIETFDACINSNATSGSVEEPGFGDTKTVPGFKAFVFTKLVTPLPSIPKQRAPALNYIPSNRL